MSIHVVHFAFSGNASFVLYFSFLVIRYIMYLNSLMTATPPIVHMFYPSIHYKIIMQGHLKFLPNLLMQ
jgi:hypothetical protein